MTEGVNTAFVAEQLQEASSSAARLQGHDFTESVAEVAGLLIACYRAGAKAVFMGNGGSAAEASHLAAEFMGRYLQERPALPALALCDSTPAITAIANDYGYADVFARQAGALLGSRDVLIGLSTSGQSEGVVRALQLARCQGIVTIAMTGAAGGRVAEAAEYCVRVPATSTPRVQEAHLIVGHTLCEIVESTLFPAS